MSVAVLIDDRFVISRVVDLPERFKVLRVASAARAKPHTVRKTLGMCEWPMKDETCVCG